MHFKDIAILIFALALVGCAPQKTSTLGKLALSNDDSFSVRANISSTHWPSRLVWFNPVGAGMNAYSEPIYNATLATSLTNRGATPFSVELQSGERLSWTLAPEQSAQLPRVAFKDFRVTIVPASNKTAEAVFDFHLDRRYSTGALLVATGHGPDSGAAQAGAILYGLMAAPLLLLPLIGFMAFSIRCGRLARRLPFGDAAFSFPRLRRHRDELPIQRIGLVRQ